MLKCQHIDLWLYPLNGHISGIKLPRRKSRNVSLLTVLVIISIANKPSVEIAAIDVIFWPLTSNR